MLAVIFLCLLGIIFGRLTLFAFRAAWSIGSVILSIVFLPLIILFAFFKGLLEVAWPLLVIYGIYCLFKTK